MDLSHLERDTFQESDFTFSIELTDGTTTHDLEPYLISVGDISEDLYGHLDQGSNSFEYPSLVISLDNEDGHFSPSHSNSLFGSDYVGWYVRFSLLDNQTNKYLVPPTTFDVVDVELDQFTASVTSVHQLQKVWSRVWNMEKDSQDVDFDGLTRYGPKWGL